MPFLIKHSFNCSFETSYPGPKYIRTALTREPPSKWFKLFKNVIGINNLKVLKIKEISQSKFLKLRHLRQFWTSQNFDRYNKKTKKYE
jgi:hypothetical protein